MKTKGSRPFRSIGQRYTADMNYLNLVDFIISRAFYEIVVYQLGYVEVIFSDEKYDDP